jgi:hypothetical protein
MSSNLDGQCSLSAAWDHFYDAFEKLCLSLVKEKAGGRNRYVKVERYPLLEVTSQRLPRPFDPLRER